MAGILSAYTPLGASLLLTGATQATRYAGATTSGSPQSGTFATGDFIVDQSGALWVCTAAGSPGTWVQIGGAAGSQNRLGVFGTGADSTTTFDGVANPVAGATLSGSTYTLTRDIYATTVTVNAGITVNPVGFRIFARTSITVANTGVISANGNNAVTGTGGAAVGGAAPFGASGVGGNGGTGVNGTGANGGTAVLGVSGGNGGAGTSGAAGNGGATNVGNANAINNLFQTPYAVLAAATSWNGSVRQLQSGSGGGGGGSDASSNAGGGGGSGGGIIALLAPSVVNNGSITSNGGNGANGTGGNAGGGGGGSGGYILVYTTSAWTAGTTSVAAGTKGTHVGTGSDGVNGGVGQVVNVVLA